MKKLLAAFCLIAFSAHAESKECSYDCYKALKLSGGLTINDEITGNVNFTKVKPKDGYNMSLVYVHSIKKNLDLMVTGIFHSDKSKFTNNYSHNLNMIRESYAVLVGPSFHKTFGVKGSVYDAYFYPSVGVSYNKAEKYSGVVDTGSFSSSFNNKAFAYRAELGIAKELQSNLYGSLSFSLNNLGKLKTKSFNNANAQISNSKVKFQSVELGLAYLF